MKIALISSVFLPIKCGLSNTMYNLSKNLFKQGHDVTVIIPYYPADESFPIEERIDGVRLIRFLFPMEIFFRCFSNKFFGWIYVREILAFPVVTLKFIRFLKKERFDIVNLHFVSCYMPSVLIAKAVIKFKLIVTLQGYSSHVLPVGSWFHRWIFKKALQKADFLTAISKYELDMACKIESGIKNKCTVIPNGMNFNELKPRELDAERYLSSIQRAPDGLSSVGKKQNIKIKEPFILFIGSLYAFNGVDLLIAAFNDVLKKGQECRLVIIGDGYEERYLKNLAALFGIDSKVYILSGLKKDAIDELVESSLFYVKRPRIDPIGEIYPKVLECQKRILTLVSTPTESISESVVNILNNGKEGLCAKLENKSVVKPYIFSLGRFEKYKRFDTLIYAFRKVIERGFDINLLIGGEGKEINNYYELLYSLGLQEKIYFLGFLDRERVIKFYQNCELFVSAFENEPFGVVVIEAMAVGKPVIAPRTGAMPELIKDGLNGIMVEPGSEIALADAMCRLLKDKNLRDRLGSQARHSIGEKYNWDRISQSYDKVYRTMD